MINSAKTPEKKMKAKLGLHFLTAFGDIKKKNMFDEVETARVLGVDVDKVMEDKKFYYSKIDNLRIKLEENKMKLEEASESYNISEEYRVRYMLEIESLNWIIWELLAESDIIDIEIEELKYDLDGI